MTTESTRPVTWRIPLPHRDNDGKPLTFGTTDKGRYKLTITSNSHHNRWKRHSVQKRLRTVTADLLKGHRIPPQNRVRVWCELHHPEKGKKYLMDAGNLADMSKPIIDALQKPNPGRWSEKKHKRIGVAAGAGIVPHDGEEYVTQEQDRIVRGSTDYTTPMIVFVVEAIG